MRLLPRAFFARDAVEVARELVGKHLKRGRVILRITEVEAYRWPGDTACHARAGRTRRNAALWGPPGRAYVYLCYGLHHMVNLVTGREGIAAAVLIRSCEAVAGQALIRKRRGARDGPGLLVGPGNVGQALAVDTSWSGHVLYRSGGLSVHEGQPVESLLVGPRVGVDYAAPAHRRLPWRFASEDSACVSHRRGLQPLR